MIKLAKRGRAGLKFSLEFFHSAFSTFAAVKVLNERQRSVCRGRETGSIGSSAEVCKNLNVPAAASSHAIITQEEPGLSGLFCPFVIRSQMLFVCHFVFLITKLTQEDNHTSLCALSF